MYQIFPNSSYSTSIDVSLSALSVSGREAYGSNAFLLFRLGTVFSISPLDVLSALIWSGVTFLQGVS